MSTPGSSSGPDYGQPYPGAQPSQPYGYGGQPMPNAPVHAQYATPQGPVGTVRPTGIAILLFVVTLGFYSWYYVYVTHEEMKKHSGEGIGGVLALVLAVFVGLASPYLHSHEVGNLYDRRGQAKPVSAMTGLWVFPGMFILVGPIVWFVKSNGALNDYWRSLGAQG
ncbi:DUF4234 domain-containing protein [Blastococcus goldschmidtiae]|uniref:DUF4234 domain-containing protein n=1 Tax=Blastococcus goldschmidtiae TaxID=3075546 RepID=A0ABU2KCV3_9ACTN|nr:DUF4234 domain-containing protein [Blastococcus sp. DSM 46792]MDT0278029.1 DUF4234 domain-containing protein [Blastococcus sp. DSM 46792]